MEKYIDAMLMDLELDPELVACEYEIASEYPTVDLLQAGAYWDATLQTEAFKLITTIQMKTIKLKVERND